MINLVIQQEAIITSEYVNAISNVLQTSKKLSVPKTLLFSYVLRREPMYYTNIYNGKTKKSALFKCISTICGSFDDFCSDLQFSLQAIDILCTSGVIELIEDKLNFKEPKGKVLVNPFLELAIEESARFSDRQILKEILRNV